MTASGTVPNAFAFCESIVNQDNKILIASLLKNSDSIGWFVRPGTPIPDQNASTAKVIQAQLVTSVVKENESYLGKVQCVLVHQEMADVILFPLEKTTILCVVVVRPYDLEQMVAKVSDSLGSL